MKNRTIHCSDRRCTRLRWRVAGFRAGAGRSVADALRLLQQRRAGRHRALLGHDGVRGQEAAADRELLSHPPCRSLHDLGYRLSGGGAGATPADRAVKVTLVEQLAQLKIKPEQINYVGISHYHGDHTGQAASFPQATLLIGQGDWDVLKGPTPSGTTNAAPLKHWLDGAGKAEPVAKDKDVFGDGTVVMLDMPGHTPGHHSLLVKLQGEGQRAADAATRRTSARTTSRTACRPSISTAPTRSLRSTASSRSRRT